MSQDQLKQLAEAYTDGGTSGNEVIAGFSVWGLMAGLLFSGIGFVVFVYGKKQANLKQMILGVLLLVYPFVIRETLMLCVVGVALCAALYFPRE